MFNPKPVEPKQPTLIGILVKALPRLDLRGATAAAPALAVAGRAARQSSTNELFGGMKERPNET